MIICDLCGEAKVCLPKEIDGREYDICSACWNVLTQKLQGKGRRIRETVFLPLPRTPDPGASESIQRTSAKANKKRSRQNRFNVTNMQKRPHSPFARRRQSLR